MFFVVLCANGYTIILRGVELYRKSILMRVLFIRFKSTYKLFDVITDTNYLQWLLDIFSLFVQSIQSLRGEIRCVNCFMLPYNKVHIVLCESIAVYCFFEVDFYAFFHIYRIESCLIDFFKKGNFFYKFQYEMRIKTETLWIYIYN